MLKEEGRNPMKQKPTKLTSLHSHRYQEDHHLIDHIEFS